MVEKSQYFGLLRTVEKVFPKDRNRGSGTQGAMWLCQCDCNEQIVVPERYLLSGGVLSCGCQKRPKKKENKINAVSAANSREERKTTEQGRN